MPNKGILKDVKEMKTLSKGITHSAYKKGGPKKFMKKGDMMKDEGYAVSGPKRQKNKSQMKIVNTPTKLNLSDKPAYKAMGGMAKYYEEGGAVLTGRQNNLPDQLKKKIIASKKKNMM